MARTRDAVERTHATRKAAITVDGEPFRLLNLPPAIRIRPLESNLQAQWPCQR